MVKVENVNGTADREPNGQTSWLAYWEAKTGLKENWCHSTDCYVKYNVVGAHVKKVGTNDNRWYIVPLCKNCNMRTDEFYVDDRTTLVHVNQ